jgi:hypothetical protein
MVRRVPLRESEGEDAFEPFCGDSAPMKKRSPELRCAGAFPAGSSPQFGSFCNPEAIPIG